MQEDDLQYYRRRIAEERANEAQATTPDVRAVHRRLAELYGDRIEALDGAARPGRTRRARPHLRVASVNRTAS